MKFIAIDIGGTNIKYGKVEYKIKSDHKRIYDVKKTETEAHKGGRYVLDKIKKIIETMIEDDKYYGIAISSAGQIDPVEGHVIYATEGIPDYTGIQIKSELESSFDIAVSVDNDVNAAALGEYWCSDVQEDFIALTLGTGIGGAIVCNGSIYRGGSFSAGEFGHMTLIYKGLPCNCGQTGCYERYASAAALDRMIEDRFDHLDTAEFFSKCRQDDDDCLKILDQWLDYLTEGLKSIVHIFNPRLIKIGGGVTVQGDYLESLINEKLKSKVMASFRNSLNISFMTHGNDANLLGAVYHHLLSRNLL